MAEPDTSRVFTYRPGVSEPSPVPAANYVGSTWYPNLPDDVGCSLLSRLSISRAMVEAGWQGFEQDTERVELGDEPSVQIAVHIVGKSESEQAVEADSEFEVRVCRSSAGEVYEIENAEGVVWRVRNSVKYLTTLENIARALECTYLDLQKDLPVEALIGHESYVSAAPRIITDGADTGWLADTHWAVSSRILSLCSHGVQRAVDVGPVRGPGSNHVIASWLNRIPELMRGVRCAQTTRNAGHHHFYAMRNTWMAFRDLMSFSNSLRPPTKQNHLIVYGDEYSDRRALWTRALQCGASLPDIAAAAIDPQMTRRLKASALDGLIQNLRPEDSWAATLNLIESKFLPVAIELFLFLGVLKYVASDMRSKGGQIYATDLSDHLFNERWKNPSISKGVIQTTPWKVGYCKLQAANASEIWIPWSNWTHIPGLLTMRLGTSGKLCWLRVSRKCQDCSLALSSLSIGPFQNQ
jgi:hypothetical protein